MCFSTSASFAAAGVLGVIGVISINKIKEPGQILFACIPLLFSLQQLLEGFVWIFLSTRNNLAEIPIYIFVFFAQIVWMIWVPLSFLLMEKDLARKKTLRIILSIGIALGIYHTYCLFQYSVSAEIHGKHILYILDFPLQSNIGMNILYLITIIIPPIISSRKKTAVLSILLIISFTFTKLMFNDYIISVWCFFAAIISIYVIKSMNEKRTKNKYFT